jgi:hypothetical protein
MTELMGLMFSYHSDRGHSELGPWIREIALGVKMVTSFGPVCSE